VVRQNTLLPLATAAGLVDLESRWRHESMSGQSTQVDQSLVTLESQRGTYGALGRELEEYGAKYPGRPVEAGALAQAAQAFIDEGDIESQMRVMRTAVARNALAGPLLDRYLGLLVTRQPDELLAVVRGNGSADVRNRAVQIAIGSGRQDLAYRAVAGRGGGMPTVWTRAYTALAGQYFDDHAPAIDAAFQSALDTRTIGERLKTPLKPDSVIAGRVWFYYGARYGEHLATGKSSAADEWLPASLEAEPDDPEAYVALGDWYAEAGQGAKAITEFEAALQLDADRADAHDHIARVLWSEGRQAEAIARWKAALSTLLRIQSRGVRVPEPFWHRAAETFTDIGERHAMGPLRGDIAHLLGDYYQRNKEYRFDQLMEPAAAASVTSGEGVAWLVELSRSMQYPDSMLHSLTLIKGLSVAQRLDLQREQVALAEKQAESQFGDAREWAVRLVNVYREELVSRLLDSGDVPGASAEWRLIPVPARRSRWDGDRDRDAVEIRLASRTGALDALLERYRTQPDWAPSVETLRNAAIGVREEHDENGARALLEYLYDREIRAGHLEAGNFIGLAEVKLERGDTAAAIALLNRMALVVADDFETLSPAAELLAKYGKNAEAADFLRRRIKAVPWDAAARVQLARTLPSGDAARAPLLAAVVTDSQAVYQLRAEAVRMSVGRASAAASSTAPAGASSTAPAAPAGTELAILSGAAVSPEAASKSYQVEARMEAARESFDAGVKLRLWQEALAIAPTDPRVRLGALRAAIAAGRDSLALAIEKTQTQAQYREFVPPESLLGEEEHAAVAEALAAAAERVDDLISAENYVQAAIRLRPPDRRDALERRLNALKAEQERRAKNAARLPAVKNAIEQDHAVRPQILRSAQ
jgi:tetratricopeptide (TPR) repeat protein